jgi:hypothetical protein
VGSDIYSISDTRKERGGASIGLERVREIPILALDAAATLP